MLKQRPYCSRCLSIAGFGALLAACSSLPYERSDHFDGYKFFNPDGPSEKGLWQVLQWQLSGGKVPWPKERTNTLTPQLAERLEAGAISTTFVNHASHLIQVTGLNIITDPVFSARTSPLQWIGPKRVRPPALTVDQLPKIDVVLISHNHFDHMDWDSVSALSLRFNPLFITPLGNAQHLQSMGAKRIVELDWWQSHPAAADVQISVVPAQHWSTRGLGTNRALWGGFVVQAYGKKIYFAGDTGYNRFFKAIFECYGSMDLSFLPIGAYEPRWFMKEQHMNPEEAVKAHLDLGSKFSVGTHFGTFQLTDEGIDQPLVDLKDALMKYKVSDATFKAPDHGETFFLK